MLDFNNYQNQIYDLSKLTVSSTSINPELYGKYDVKRGLRDLNGNGVLDINVVTSLIDVLLSGNVADMDIADVDRNGTISIDDVTRMIDLLLNS